MLEILENWNIDTFHWMNAGVKPPFPIRIFALFSAQVLIYLLAGWMLFAWIRGSRRARVMLLYALVSIVLGLTINQIIGLIGYHPRPFEMGIGQTLLPHAVDSSFPSDHAVVFFSAGLAFLCLRDSRGWGLWVSACGLAVAWSRIYLGVHFPLDMLGSLLVAIPSTALAYRGLPLLENRLEPLLTRFYERIVVLLHLPGAWFQVNPDKDGNRSE